MTHLRIVLFFVVTVITALPALSRAADQERLLRLYDRFIEAYERLPSDCRDTPVSNYARAQKYLYAFKEAADAAVAVDLNEAERYLDAIIDNYPNGCLSFSGVAGRCSEPPCPSFGTSVRPKPQIDLTLTRSETPARVNRTYRDGSYDEVQNLYVSVSRSNSCSKLRSVIDELETYTRSKVRIPADKEYTLRFGPSPRLPRVGNLARDRIIRLESGMRRNNCARRTTSPRAPRAAGIKVFQHCNYGGYGVTLDVGDYDLSAFRALGIRNDDLSSIRVPPGYKATIYEHSGFQGRRRVLTADDECFVNSRFNDIVSAIRVRRR